ncbi:MAG: hypothetical protein AMXMBFR64_12280 [Myxococcales bacterium]
MRRLALLLLLGACRGDLSPSDTSAADTGTPPTVSEAGCDGDAICAAVLPGLPPCRAARCDTTTGGCHVEFAPDGAPCVSEAPGCGGQCSGGNCVPRPCP